ncbi:MAG: molybdenum cofactor synthesis domain-containing protein [Planctomycetota bacterium]|jgi:molybdenum cofactor synthesis domain-containing protein
MSNKGRVISVNISEEKGTVKKAVPQISIDHCGVVGDAHAGPWHRQVSLLAQEDIDFFVKEMGRQIAPGEFAENISLSGIDLGKAAILDRFRIGQVELQVTQIGKECHGDGCAIYREIGKCVMPKKGLFCRVINGGNVEAGDSVEYIPKLLRILIITLSDRAYAGEYSDRSGPRAKQILEEYFSDKRWHLLLDNMIFADDAEQLTEKLNEAISGRVDVILTLGGTGIGPRDITPETIAAVCDKTIPGIMENIRVKYGKEKPSALLSRSIAATAGRTQIYALPGSVRAVEEYLAEILKTLEHAVFMIHGLDVH